MHIEYRCVRARVRARVRACSHARGCLPAGAVEGVLRFPLEQVRALMAASGNPGWARAGAGMSVPVLAHQAGCVHLRA
jgi:hypothetical protein